MSNTCRSKNKYVADITTCGHFLYETSKIKNDNNYKVKMFEQRGFPILMSDYKTLINSENDLYYKCDKDGLQSHMEEFNQYCSFAMQLYKSELDALQSICNSICDKTGECLYYIIDEDQITTSELRLSCMPSDKIYLYYKLFNDYRNLIKLIMCRILNYLDSMIYTRQCENNRFYNNNNKNKKNNNVLHAIPI